MRRKREPEEENHVRWPIQYLSAHSPPPPVPLGLPTPPNYLIIPSIGNESFFLLRLIDSIEAPNLNRIHSIIDSSFDAL